MSAPRHSRTAQGLRNGILYSGLLLILGAGASAAPMVKIGNHPTSLQTAYPRIHSLHAFNGRIYLSYGDYNDYPAVVIAAYDPATNQFRLEESASNRIPSDIFARSTANSTRRTRTRFTTKTFATSVTSTRHFQHPAGAIRPRSVATMCSTSRRAERRSIFQAPATRMKAGATARF
jgi:hypothetical protein